MAKSAISNQTSALPQKLRAARLAAGLRAIDVARELGVSLQTVYRWEYGIHSPSVATLRRLAEVYGVPISELLS